VADSVEPANPQPGEREPPVASVQRIEGGVVVALRGELDLYNAGDVRTALPACCVTSSPSA
jgi:anti-anti-sigma regulatory factor